MSLPKITFLILTYNQKDYIYDAIMSGLHQDYQGDMEIIVSDDASTDGTWEEICRAIANNSSRFIVKSFRQEKNLGLGGNMSNALSLCNGDIIVYNDGDDTSVDNRVSKVVEIFENNPDIQLVTGQINWLINNKIHPLTSEEKPKSSLQRSLGEYIENNFLWDIWGCTPAYRKCLIDGWPPMFVTTPTSDSWIRLRAMMYKCKSKSIYIDKNVHVNYRIHTNQITNAANNWKMPRKYIFKQFLSDWAHAIKCKYLDLGSGFRMLPMLTKYGIASLLQFNKLWLKYRKRIYN